MCMWALNLEWTDCCLETSSLIVPGFKYTENSLIRVDEVNLHQVFILTSSSSLLLCLIPAGTLQGDICP